MGATEGFVDFRGYRTWYHLAGDLQNPAPGKLPLLLLHGGPGGTSDVFEPIDELATEGRPIIRYDQIGSGRSDRPKDPSLWTVESFVDELRTVRDQLDLTDLHLLGHSWGGMLALEYLFTQPTGVASLIMASSLATTKMWTDEAKRLRLELPEHVVRGMERCESSISTKKPKTGKPAKTLSDKALTSRARMMSRLGTAITSNTAMRISAAASHVSFLRPAAYQIFSGLYGRRFGCRLDPIPIEVYKMFAGMNRQAYETMWGPTEFFATGTLKDWDVTDRLNEIDLPTLITSGRYDEATPAQMEVLNTGINGSEWVLFENSAHCSMVEEPDAYRETLSTFLAKVES